MTVCVKIAGTQISTMQIIFIRAMLTLVFTYATLSRKKISVWGTNKGLLVLRGIAGTSALFFFMNQFKDSPFQKLLQYNIYIQSLQLF